LISEQFPKNILQRKIYWHLRQKHVQSLRLPKCCDKTDESGWAWWFLSKNMGGYGKISIERWYYSPSGAANQLTTTKNTCEGQTPYSNTGYIGHVKEWVLLSTCSVCCWQYVDFSQLVCSGHQIHRCEAGGFCHTSTIIWSPNAMR
jgi:hypothetical protein